MPEITRDHIFILPHSEEYRRFYDISLNDLLETLNTPDTHEGLPEGRYTNEKTFDTKHVFVHYYLTYPLLGDKDEVYAIIDFVGYASREDLPRPVHDTL